MGVWLWLREGLGQGQVSLKGPWHQPNRGLTNRGGQAGLPGAAQAAATWAAVTCFKVAAMASTFSQGRLRSLRPKWP